jgi:hypothetical protein
MCCILNGFRDRAISLYSSKIADKKEILRTISNTGIYCWSDKVCTGDLVFSKILPPTSMHFVTRVRTAYNIKHISIFGICEDVRHLSRHLYNVTRHLWQDTLGKQLKNTHGEMDTTCASYCCCTAYYVSESMWTNSDLHRSKSDRHIWEPCTEHTFRPAVLCW